MKVTDCSMGEDGVFPVGGGCDAKGKCHDPPSVYSGICFSYCGCDGTEVYACGDDGDGPGTRPSPRAVVGRNANTRAISTNGAAIAAATNGLAS